MSGEEYPHRPTAALHRLRAKALGISAEAASFRKRGFHAPSGEIQEHLEKVGRTFLIGYNAALLDEPVEVLGARLREVELAWQGFAFEGAAMGLSLLDRFSIVGRGRRIAEFLAGPGAAHAYMVHVGVGWMLARIPWGMERVMSRLDPVLRWLVVDGYGFHEGYFRFAKYARGDRKPRMSRGYWPRAFDQGFGRSVWFVMGTNVREIAEVIEGLEVSRRGDLWSGVGLAATYAGGGDEENLQALRAAAGEYLPQLAQGAAFAVKARLWAGNPTEHMRLACEVLCGMTAGQAAEICDAALENLPETEEIPAFEIWRRRIQSRMRRETEPAFHSLNLAMNVSGNLSGEAQ